MIAKNIKRFGLLIELWGIGVIAAALTPTVWGRETPLVRVLWVLIVVGTLVVAALLTYVEVRLRASVAAVGAHEYLSTGCRHGEHTYWQSMTGYQGEKRPGACKFCATQCICACHQVPAR
ncbi:hypothetical protein [Streptomyces sp. cg35]|uniref:hypothetical protein n=1 Tax=Streptomyces sp. cg35 TaxID=3421650 RepID=UPI003D168B67